MKILVWDTETTGLTLHPQAELALQPQIIEFAAAMVDGEEGVVERFSTLINVSVPVTAEITKITGITPEMLVGQPTFPQVAARIAELFAAAGAHLTHNLQFDRAMLLNDCARHSVAIALPERELCTIQLYTEEYGRMPKLTELYEAKIGHPLAQTHRAMDDVNALVEIVTKEQLWNLFPN
jgi:DNA polymerase III epsilon subunit-like protein